MLHITTTLTIVHAVKCFLLVLTAVLKLSTLFQYQIISGRATSTP